MSSLLVYQIRFTLLNNIFHVNVPVANFKNLRSDTFSIFAQSFGKAEYIKKKYCLNAVDLRYT
jgi:hypothetical protein